LTSQYTSRAVYSSFSFLSTWLIRKSAPLGTRINVIHLLINFASIICLTSRYHSWVNAEGMIGALFLGNHDDNAPHLGPKPPPPTANKMGPPSKPPVKTPAAELSAAASQAAIPTASKQEGPPCRPSSPLEAAPPLGKPAAAPVSHAAAAADPTKSGPSTTNTDTAAAFDGFVDVADSAAVAQEDSRLLVQVYDAPSGSDASSSSEASGAQTTELANRSTTAAPTASAASGGTAAAAAAAASGAAASSGRWVALVRHGGTLTAMDATCYHMGGPLLMADIEDVVTTGGNSQPGCKKDAALVCPWHHYRIRLSDGRRLHLAAGKGGSSSSSSSGGETYEASGEVRQRVHDVKEANGRVWVKLLDGRADSSPSATGGGSALDSSNSGNIDTGSARGPKEVMSDEYAFKKPMPASWGGGQRSGAVLQRLREQGGGKGSGKGFGGLGSVSSMQGRTASGKQRLLPAVEDAVGASMRGGDGVAPWALTKANASSSSSDSALSSTKAGAWRAPVPRFNAPRPPLAAGGTTGAGTGTALREETSSSSSPALPLTTLSPSEFKLFTCAAAVPAGRGMVRLTFRGYFFAGSTGHSLLGAFGNGAHVDVCTEVPSLKDPQSMEEQVRPYTPIARSAVAEGVVTSVPPSCGAKGPESFDLLVKSYPRGRVSRALVTTQPGQQVAMRGPMGGLPPHWLFGNPLQEKASSSSSGGRGGGGGEGRGGEGKRVHLVVVAAGTGITPALQLVYATRAAAHGNAATSTEGASSGVDSTGDGSNSHGRDSTLNVPLNVMEEGSEDEDEADDADNGNGSAAIKSVGTSTSTPQSTSPLLSQKPPPSSSVAAVTVVACNHAAVDIPLAAELAALDNWSASEVLSSPDSAATALRVRIRHLLSSAETEPGNRVSPPVPGLLGRGRISTEVLAPLVASGNANWELRLAWCGPEGFSEAMRTAATELGVDPTHCHEFG